MFCADVSGKTQTQSGAMGVSRQILSFLQAHYPVSCYFRGSQECGAQLTKGCRSGLEGQAY